MPLTIYFSYKILRKRLDNYFVGDHPVLVHNFAFVIPIATWVIGEGVVWATASTIALAAAYLVMEKHGSLSSKYCNADGTAIDLDKFSVPGRSGRRTNPKTGHYIEPNRGEGHGGKQWKLKDKNGKRLASVWCDGRIRGK